MSDDSYSARFEFGGARPRFSHQTGSVRRTSSGAFPPTLRDPFDTDGIPIPGLWHFLSSAEHPRGVVYFREP